MLESNTRHEKNPGNPGFKKQLIQISHTHTHKHMNKICIEDYGKKNISKHHLYFSICVLVCVFE